MNIENTKAQMKKGVLEFCILSVLSGGENYPSEIITKMKEAKTPLNSGTVLFNLYQQQVKKIETTLTKLPEDIQADYERELNFILN